jgi:hypothetical protein
LTLTFLLGLTLTFLLGGLTLVLFLLGGLTLVLFLLLMKGLLPARRSMGVDRLGSGRVGGTGLVAGTGGMLPTQLFSLGL